MNRRAEWQGSWSRQSEAKMVEIDREHRKSSEQIQVVRIRVPDWIQPTRCSGEWIAGRHSNNAGPNAVVSGPVIIVSDPPIREHPIARFLGDVIRSE